MVRSEARENAMYETACSKLLASLQDETGNSAVIDTRSYFLIYQALTEAVSLGTDYEIEQMVRARDVSSLRQRVQVKFEHDANDRVSSLRVTLERDGDIVRSWLFRDQNQMIELLTRVEAREAGELTDLFTAIQINMYTARQFMALEDIHKSQAIIDRIIPKMQEFWMRSRGHHRPLGVADVAIPSEPVSSTPSPSNAILP
jgi:hypothetical protein